jgi:hypothetical protein
MTTPAPEAPPSIVVPSEDFNFIPTIEILPMEPGSEPILTRTQKSASVSNSDAPKAYRPNLSTPSSISFSENFVRKPSQNALRAQTIRNAEAAGFKSIQVEDERLVQKQLKAIRDVQTLHRLQTEQVRL